MLTGSSPEKKSARKIDPKNKDVFIKGKLIFKEKLPTILFWIEGDANHYSLILFEEKNNTQISDHLKNTSDSVITVFREKVCSSLTPNVFNNFRVSYLVIDFNNEEIIDMNKFQLFGLGYEVIKQVQTKTKCKVLGYVLIANL